MDGSGEDARADYGLSAFHKEADSTQLVHAGSIAFVRDGGSLIRGRVARAVRKTLAGPLPDDQLVVVLHRGVDDPPSLLREMLDAYDSHTAAVREAGL